MNTFLIILLVVAILTLLLGLIMRRRKRTVIIQPIPDSFRTILVKDVVFYTMLDENKKTEFENRMMHFLSTTRITGVKTDIDDKDKVYVSASAIIPIFGFPNWQYTNLNEVLLYPDSFNHRFEQTGGERNILGLVGDGPFNNVMILSRQELRQAFLNKTSKTNTAIHEFVHLIDKTDGSVDGIPDFFLNRQYVLPWLNLIHKEIKKILSNDSDINPYGATNEAEFFAVVAEYFFERPDLLQTKHPDLYELLVKIFHQQPVNS